jgi:glycosyltransferase involved in cell wall biosynthesis
VKLAISVSVVIPAYNRAKTIAYCLDSVCNQTVQPFEVIVVDDCSTDGTVDIVNNYSRLHPSVRCVVLERNSGAQAARNRGIVEAKGEWIAFQDSDDEWALEKLEKQITALEGLGFDPLLVVHTDAWRYDPASGDRSVWNLPPCEGQVHANLLRSPAPLFPTMLTSKKALLQIGMLDENVPSYQEWDTAIRLATICRFVHLHEPLFVYHFHAGETISKNKMRDVEGYQYVVDKHRDDILRFCGAEVLNRHLASNALKAMRWGFYDEAKKILAKAIGSSNHITLLRLTVKRIISLRVYGFSMRMLRRFGWLAKRDQIKDF